MVSKIDFSKDQQRLKVPNPNVNFLDNFYLHYIEFYGEQKVELYYKGNLIKKFLSKKPVYGTKTGRMYQLTKLGKSIAKQIR